MIIIKNNPRIIKINDESQIKKSISKSGLEFHKPVLVLVGGADKLEQRFTSIINEITYLIVQTVNSVKGIIIDGGTTSGIMNSIGQSYARGVNQFPLVGVTVEKLVFSTRNPMDEKQFISSSTGNIREYLEPNHTHFFLVPGSNWGDESPWISKIATELSGQKPSVTVLINGGDISRKDIENSLRYRRPVIVIRGTGRLANNMNFDEKSSHLIKTIQANRKDEIRKLLKTYLLS
jgi:hypothetical protein